MTEREIKPICFNCRHWQAEPESGPTGVPMYGVCGVSEIDKINGGKIVVRVRKVLNQPCNEFDEGVRPKFEPRPEDLADI